MNKIINSLFFLSVFFIGIQAEPQTHQDLNLLDKRGYSPLHNAIFETDDIDDVSSCVEKVKSLLSAGAQVDLPDSYGRTALWWAAERNQAELIEVLLAAGANIDAKSSDGSTPLHVAACDGNKEVVKCLLAHGANPNSIDDAGCTPLHDAARGELWIYPSHCPEYQKITPEQLQDYKDIITLLIQHGTKPTIKNHAGRTPAQEARAQQQEFYPELTEYPLEVCIEQGSKIISSPSGASPLYHQR